MNPPLRLFDRVMIALGGFTGVHSSEIREGAMLVPVEAKGSEKGLVGVLGLHVFHRKHWGVHRALFL